jgi:hypothetical protein
MDAYDCTPTTFNLSDAVPIGMEVRIIVRRSSVVAGRDVVVRSASSARGGRGYGEADSAGQQGNRRAERRRRLDARRRNSPDIHWDARAHLD